MIKKVNIRVYGYGQEIVQDTYTEDEMKQIDDYIEENDEDLTSVMCEIEDLLPERDGWYECDNVSHNYGAVADSCKVNIEIDGESTEYDEVMDLEDKGAEFHYEEVGYFEGDKDMITIIGDEKGTFLDGDFELADDEEFDYTKLNIHITDVVFDGYENSLITSITYDGGDTRGKGMSAYLQKKQKEKI
jgi:hypothetical protein